MIIPHEYDIEEIRGWIYDKALDASKYCLINVRLQILSPISRIKCRNGKAGDRALRCSASTNIPQCLLILLHVNGGTANWKQQECVTAQGSSVAQSRLRNVVILSVKYDFDIGFSDAIYGFSSNVWRHSSCIRITVRFSVKLIGLEYNLLLFTLKNIILLCEVKLCNIYIHWGHWECCNEELWPTYVRIV
jgi:hypothetical protein